MNQPLKGFVQVDDKGDRNGNAVSNTACYNKDTKGIEIELFLHVKGHNRKGVEKKRPILFGIVFFAVRKRERV